MLHTVHFLCPVTPSSVSHLQGLCLEAMLQGATSLQIHISSGGGDITSGFTAYNFIKSLHIPVATHNISNIDSIANVIFLAGSERRANPGSRFLLHPMSWGFNTTSLDHLRISELGKSLDYDFQRFIDILQLETQRFDIDWVSAIERTTIADAATAANNGVVHVVAMASLANSARNWWVTC